MRIKRVLSILLVLCVVTTLLPVSAFAAGVPTSGQAGDHVTWTMRDDGTLVFSGTGATIDNGQNVVREWSTHHAQEVKHIVFEEGITYIGEWLFNTSLKYKKLESVTIPTTVSAIGEYAFTGLAGYLKKVYISDLDKWCAIDFRGNGATPFDGGTDMFLNNELVEILVIPNSVNRIPFQAFFQCSSIKTLVISESVKEIGKLAFGACDNLVKVVFQGNAPTVDGKLFTNTKPFVYYPKTKSSWTKTAIQAYDAGATWVAYDPATENVISDSFPGGEAVGGIKWSFDEESKTLSFSGKGDMDDYDATLSYVPWRAYQNETEKIVLAEGITRIGDYAFFEFQQAKEIVLPSTLQTIGDGAFNRCVNLEKIDIPAGVTEIGLEAFASCAKLTSIKIPEGVTRISGGMFEMCSSLTDVTLPDGITVIGASAFYYCALTDIEIPESVTLIGDQAFANSLQQSCTLTFSQSLEMIGQSAFADCSGIEKISFQGNAPAIASGAFQWVTADVYYPGDNETWTAEVMQNYGGNLTWVPHTHDYTVQGVEPTCTEGGFASYTCNTCGYYYEVGSDIPLGHEMGEWTVTVPAQCTVEGEQIRYCSRCDYSEIQPTLPTDHSWQDTAEEGIHTCTVCGLTEGKYRLYVPGHKPKEATTAWIDGVEYGFKEERNQLYIPLTHPNGTSMSMFIYKNTESEDIHTHYPVIMSTWLIKYTDDYGQYYVDEVHNLFYYSILQYSGCSIRIKGVKGIRMITGVHETTRKVLMGKGISALNHTYKLAEYGTLLAWAKDLEGGNPLTLGQSYVKSNYAYKRGVADPIFSKDAQNVNYTNVLVGFTLDQCKDDIAMRPYMILEDEGGNRAMIYGGIVYRSIGYIAYQNRNVFQPKTAAYNYVWEIIHHVYGDKYDADYKG